MLGAVIGPDHVGKTTLIDEVSRAWYPKMRVSGWGKPGRPLQFLADAMQMVKYMDVRDKVLYDRHPAVDEFAYGGVYYPACYDLGDDLFIYLDQLLARAGMHYFLIDPSKRMEEYVAMMMREGDEDWKVSPRMLHTIVRRYEAFAGVTKCRITKIPWSPDEDPVTRRLTLAKRVVTEIVQPRFAAVAPPKLQIALYNRGMTGNYHLMLAHDVQDTSATSLEASTISEAVGFDETNEDIIMDNSVVELGEAVDVKQMLRAIRRVPARYIALPDVLLDSVETVKKAMDARANLETNLPELVGSGFMGVVQGNTMDECVTCAIELSKIPRLTMLGIPRVLVKAPMIGSRIDIVKTIASHVGIQMHLLGFSDNMADDIMAAKLPGVVGIDSAVPVRLGWQGKTMSGSPAEVFPPRPPSYWIEASSEKAAEYQIETIFNNILAVRGWLRVEV